MVLQINTSWRQKITWVAMAHYTPDMFVKSQWQRRPGVSVFYLVYRWLMASVFCSILLTSLVELGRPRGDVIHYAKWVIYLTHWGFTICVVQAVLAAYLVSRAHCKYKEAEVEAMKMNWCLRLYWVLYNIGTTGAFAITTIYWCFVFDPDESALDVVNVGVHACNSILMFIDLLITSHPIRLIDFYWSICFALCYTVFNFIYYLAGGTDRNGRPYVYKILDWRNPWKAVIVVQCCLLFLLLLHVSACLICFVKRKIVECMRNRGPTSGEETARSRQGATNNIPIKDLV